MLSQMHYQRLFQAPRSSFFLFGIRGSGKSTWARQQFPQAHFVDLLDEELHQSLLLDSGKFAGELRTRARGSWVIVDEVQRIPSLLNEVHRFMEQVGLRFVLLGSSARKLKTVGTNLLAGRALQKTLYPFTPEELGKDFRVEEVLRYGSLPLVWQSETRQETLQAYVQLYLREEIRLESLVRNLPGFTRFLPVAALFHGQTLNVQSLARDAGVARMTVAGYLDILEDTLLAFRLPAFEAKLRVRERKHPKLYWVDPGIVRAVKRQFGPVSSEERGALTEGWIAVLLRIYGEYRNLCEECFYWAPTDSHATEVDFLLRRGREYLAIEVKTTKNISSVHLSGLRAIADLPGLTRRILLYFGTRRLKTEDAIDVLPLEAFLEALAANTLWTVS